MVSVNSLAEKDMSAQSGVGVMVGVLVFVGVRLTVEVGVAKIMNVFATITESRPSMPVACA